MGQLFIGVYIDTESGIVTKRVTESVAMHMKYLLRSVGGQTVCEIVRAYENPLSSSEEKSAKITFLQKKEYIEKEIHAVRNRTGRYANVGMHNDKAYNSQYEEYMDKKIQQLTDMLELLNDTYDQFLCKSWCIEMLYMGPDVHTQCETLPATVRICHERVFERIKTMVDKCFVTGVIPTDIKLPNIIGSLVNDLDELRFIDYDHYILEKDITVVNGAIDWSKVDLEYTADWMTPAMEILTQLKDDNALLQHKQFVSLLRENAVHLAAMVAVSVATLSTPGYFDTNAKEMVRGLLQSQSENIEKEEVSTPSRPPKRKIQSPPGQTHAMKFPCLNSPGVA